MYGLVPYNISPIQQGIQFGHAVVEYALKHSKDPLYLEWARSHKTFIILNGGTTNNNAERLGTMQSHLMELQANKIKLASFSEPDLNDTLTAVVFLVDERVFDKKKYPDHQEAFEFSPFLTGDQRRRNEEHFAAWEKSMGDSKNIFLREFLKPLRLA